MSAHLARLPASAHPVCSVSNCGRYAGQLPSMRRVSSSCSLSSPELSGDYLPTASVLSEMPRSDDFSSNSSSMIFASSNCFRSFTICRLGYVCCKCCGGYEDHWSPEQLEMDRKLSILNHSVSIPLTRPHLAMAVFESAIWVSRPLITPLRTKSAAIWEACKYRMVNTAVFPTVEDILGNFPVCEECETPVVQVCPRRDCPVTTCPPPPSCLKCPEVATASSSFPPRSSPPPPAPDHSIVIIVGSATVGAVAAVLATLVVMWFVTRRPTKESVEEGTNDDEPPVNIECHPLIEVQSPSTTVAQAVITTSFIGPSTSLRTSPLLPPPPPTEPSSRDTSYEEVRPEPTGLASRVDSTFAKPSLQDLLVETTRGQ